jgi:maleate cis-trans isomerase
MTRTSLATAHRRYHSYAGFVTTPPYFDDSPQQFLDVAPRGTGAIQRVLHVPDYAWQLDQRARNFGLLEEAAGCLADSQCDVIGQVGSNWVHCRGTTGPAEIEAFCARLKEQTGVAFLMAGHCMVEGLRAIGAETITVANGYYRDDWSAGINGYLEAAGFTILWAGDLIDQGLVADHEAKLRIEEATLWDYPDHLMSAAAVDAHRRAPNADAVVQTGAGFRMMQVVDAVEGEIATPVVGSDFALYWAMLRELGRAAGPGWGHLLSTLDETTERSTDRPARATVSS